MLAILKRNIIMYYVLLLLILCWFIVWTSVLNADFQGSRILGRNRHARNLVQPRLRWTFPCTPNQSEQRRQPGYKGTYKSDSPNWQKFPMWIRFKKKDCGNPQTQAVGCLEERRDPGRKPPGNLIRSTNRRFPHIQSRLFWSTGIRK